MTNKAKILAGVVAGAAAGICIGVLMSDTELLATMKDGLADAGGKINSQIKELMEENSEILGELREKLSDIPRSVTK